MSSLVDVARRRVSGDYTVDEFGLDDDLVDVVTPLFRLRWGIGVGGAAALPADGPVLLVHNRSLGYAAQIVTASAVRRETGRTVRVAGAPDLPVVGPVARRLGAVLAGPDEMASVLRAGLVGAVSVANRHLRAAESTDELVAIVADARTHGVPVHPVAVFGRPVGRAWRAEVGGAVDVDHPAGPLGDARAADGVRDALVGLLDRRRAG